MMAPRHRVILDLRGLMLHSYYSGEPVDFVMGADGKKKPKAVHGLNNFINYYLAPILENTAPIDVIAVLEGGSGNSRRRAYLEKYKAGKSQDEDDEIVQAQKDELFEAVRKLLFGLGCMVVKTQYAEADDTIAYLVQRMRGSKMVYTVDNDLLQLVDGKNEVGFIIDKAFKTTFKGMALKPYNPVVMYKAVVGDPSDKIPGVAGFGEKTWKQLVEKYGMEGIAQIEECVKHDNYAELEESAADCKILNKLYMQRSEMSLCYKLAKLHPEWCESTYGSKVVRPKWEKRIPTIERLRDVLEPYGLTEFLEGFRKHCVKRWLLDGKQLAKTKMDPLYAAMRNSWFTAFDYESYDSVKHEPYQRAKKSGGYIDTLHQIVTGASFCFGANFQYAFYMPIKHRDTHNCKKEDLKEILDAMDGTELLAHNDSFEQTVSATNFDKRFDHMLDSSIMGHYVDENKRHALKLSSKADLNYSQLKYEDIVESGKDMRDVSGDEVLDYGCDDSICAAHLAILYIVQMECEGTWQFYYDNETYFTRAMLDGFLRGVPMDWDRLTQLKEDDDALYDKSESELRTLLSEHCSDINMDGFTTLWAEISEFEKRKLQEKEKSEDEIESILAGKKAKLLIDCKYNALTPPPVDLEKKTIANIARQLNLPSIRSLKEEWIATYYDGIQAQLADPKSGASASPEQLEFLNLLNLAVRVGTQDDVDSLESWVRAFIGHDKSLWSGDELNEGSPDQMARLFYGKMGLPIQLRNISKDGKDQRSLFEMEGAPTTNENAVRTWMSELDKSTWQYKVLDAVLTMRGVRTRRQLYYRPYPLWKSPSDGRMHPQIRNCGTITRRPSGTCPNILQVSKTKDEGHIRSTYLPQSADQTDIEPEVIVSIDWNQEELVILAGESNDPNLRACYQGDQRRDVHTTTGVMIYNVRNKDRKPVEYAEFEQIVEDESDSDEPDITRRGNVVRKVYAKRTNFLVTYGGGPGGLARKLIVPKQMAESFIDAFFSAYPKVLEFQEQATREAKTFGFVADCFGNRRHLYKIMDTNKGIAKSAERQAGNFKIQGGAASVLKVALRKIAVNKVMERHRATLIAPIYDEKVCSCPVSQVYSLITELADIMEMELPGLNISLETSVSIGKNWGDQIELKRRPSKEKVEAALAEIFNTTEKLAA